MAENTIDASLLAHMFLTGAQNLDAKKDWINELNVFPVPDGDTGTNMTMTIMSAVHMVQDIDSMNMKDLAKAISSGSLRGARGNSGVILSQLFRGFTKVVKGSDEIDIPMIADACEKAVETAYKAVIKPKEGTILTVAKGMAEIARKLVDAQMTLDVYIKNIIDYGNEVLAKTPEMLPVLKEAGVVDSGGQGLITILEGAYDGLMGKEVDPDLGKSKEAPAPEEGTPEEKAPEKPRFIYSAEFIINSQKSLPQAQIDELRTFLVSNGEQVVMIPDARDLKVHVHTNDPGQVLSRALTLGRLTSISIDNLLVEHHEKLIKNPAKAARDQADELLRKTSPAKPVGFIEVCAGDGFEEIFRGLGADYIIKGGQTMNPSTEDVLDAIDQVNAENIFLFPNNKNIIMAARQAQDLVREKNIIVIPSRTIPQGITALLGYDAAQNVEANQAAMMDAIANVHTSEVTYAIRDTTIDSVEIHQGDIMAVGDDGILSVGRDIDETALASVEKMMFDGAELISIYFGKEYSEENANRLAQKITEKFPDVDVEVNNGGQPVYYCILSVE
ncbi:MAG: DAK2 domain-containing protein [Bilifractor sp.]